jgi:8-oxo-dGTP pyrophosphatase MutT (NUDIX family)
MFDKLEITHHIERDILKVLLYRDIARYAEMRPPRVDSNLYAYHLNKLVKGKVVEKSAAGYKLSSLGLRYMGYMASDTRHRLQPKIVTGVVVKKDSNYVMLTQRKKQPFLGEWALPMGKLHLDDENILAAAKRELYEATGANDVELRHVGDCYLRTRLGGEEISNLLAHIFLARAEIVGQGYFDVREIEQVMPGVREIVELVETGGRFFREITVER